ncbi:MAG: ribonuclease H-like domain-containing protein [Desulfovibrionaceae bacterium]|nr:ribonuclease H-like domain-containing protein [Desulfovibrionaceae bacterium]
MLTSGFLHLPGIGPATDAKLRAAGLDNWEKALAHPAPPLNPATLADFRRGLLESQERLDRLGPDDALWFSERLPPREQWRLFPHFRSSAAYVDIETNGLGGREAVVTAISLYDGKNLRSYVNGRDLEGFPEDLSRHSLLVTWNGRAFDLPFIRRCLRIPARMAHLDLLPVFRAMNLRGGLKKVEKSLGLDRDELEGVDGLDAVRLWREHQIGVPGALETLLAYNAADVLSLERLCLHACATHGLELPSGGKTRNPYRADISILARLKAWRKI